MKSSVTSRWTSALLLLFPMVLLSGCGMLQKPQVEYRTVSKPVLPLPAELTRRIEVPPVPESMTFGQAVELSAQLYGVIEQCNIDRDGIRQIETTRASLK